MVEPHLRCRVLGHTLMDIDPQYPQVDADKLKDLADTRVVLEGEAPDGTAADPFQTELAAEAERKRPVRNASDSARQTRPRPRPKAKATA